MIVGIVPKLMGNYNLSQFLIYNLHCYQICQMDEEAIRLSALHSLFDIILVHGIECFQEEKKSKKTGKV